MWTLTLQRPDKRNALSAALVDELLATVEEAHAQRARVLVFRGAGRNFSAGFDFSGIDSDSDGDLLLRFVRIETLLQAVAASPCLTVALAHGQNFGAGVDLIAACRYRVAAPAATFRMPGLKFGLVLGTRRFGEIVGRADASRILEESATFDAAEALAHGFVQRISAQEAWHETIAEARARAAALDDVSRSLLYNALSGQQPDADLAAVVRSAARPGLKERLARYIVAG
jgi:enoyl-CoA hydratase/carnithine racemase